MPTQTQLRRGTTAEHAAFTGAVGETTVNTSQDRLVVHDGATAGGIPQATETEVLKKANDLSDVASAATSRANLSVHSIAEVNARSGPRPGERALNFDGVDDYVSISDNVNLSFIASPFSGSAWVKMNTADSFIIITKWPSTANKEWGFFVNSSDKLVLEFRDESIGVNPVRVSDSAITTYEGEWTHLAFTHDGGNGATAMANAKLYVNGVVVASTATEQGTFVDLENLTGAVEIGKRLTAFADGEIKNASIFNRELTAAGILNLYLNGISFADKEASPTVLTSGTLVVGKRYRIIDWITADDFTNIGGTNADGTEFVATGTTPTTWTNSSTVVAIGAIGEWNLENSDTVNSSVLDASGNGFHGTLTGSPVLVNQQTELHIDTRAPASGDIVLSVADDGTDKFTVKDDGTTAMQGPLSIDSNAANTAAIATFENTAGDIQVFRSDATPEGSITGSIGDFCVDGTNGIFYIKHTGSASNTGWLSTGGTPTLKSYSFVAPGTASGEYFVGGFYTYAAADANLTQASTTVTHGGANAPYAAHAFIVSGGNGTTDGSDLVLTVTGTSITDGGTRTGADSEVIEATAGTSAADTYFETSKKWLGQITYTLSSTGGSTFSYDFNYGFCKYEDFANTAFTIDNFEATGTAGGNDSSFNIELIHHNATGWTYHATAFVAGPSSLLNMNTIHSTEQDIDTDEPFAFKRTGLTTAVAGDVSEGTLIRITTGANGSVDYLNAHLGVLLQ